MENEQIYVIDPVVVVDSRPETVEFWGAIGSALSTAARGVGTVASKLGSVLKSPVAGKLLEGGLSIGGGLYMAKQAKKQTKAQIAAEKEAAKAAAATASRLKAEADAQEALAAAEAARNRKRLLYLGAAAAGGLGLYLILRKKN